MPVDEGLAHLSDNLFAVTVVVYTLAMLAFAVEYAFGRRGRIAVTADEPAAYERTPALVGAGGPPVGSAVAGPSATSTSPVPTREVPTPADARRHARRGARAGALGVALLLAGWALHVGTLATRGLSVGRVPWGNMYEFSTAVALLAVTAYLVLLVRLPVRHLGAFVLLPVVLWLGLAGTVLYAPAGPLVPALDSYWIKIHVTAAVTATGVFMVGTVFSALYLVRDRWQERTAAGEPVRFPVTLGARLPEAAWLDRTAYRVIAFGFPVWTFAIIAGAIWAEAAWGRYWGWDPKETWSFIAWVVYAGYLHARATGGWRGRPAAMIALVGFGAMTVNYFVVNMVIAGLHSYAGVG